MSAALTSLLARTSSTVSVPTSLSAGSTGLSSVYTSLQEAESFTEKEEGIEISVLTVTSKPSLSLFATVTVAGIFMLTAPEPTDRSRVVVLPASVFSVLPESFSFTGSSPALTVASRAKAPSLLLEPLPVTETVSPSAVTFASNAAYVPLSSETMVYFAVTFTSASMALSSQPAGVFTSK